MKRLITYFSMGLFLTSVLMVGCTGGGESGKPDNIDPPPAKGPSSTGEGGGGENAPPLDPP